MNDVRLIGVRNIQTILALFYSKSITKYIYDVDLRIKRLRKIETNIFLKKCFQKNVSKGFIKICFK